MSQLNQYYDWIDTRNLGPDGPVYGKRGDIYAIQGLREADQAGIVQAGAKGRGLHCPGVDGNFASMPFTVNTSASTVEWRVKTGLVDWASAQALTGSNAALFFTLQVIAGGFLRLQVSFAGGSAQPVSTAALGFSSFSERWISAILNTSTGIVTFRTADDLTLDHTAVTGWSQLGDPVDGGQTGALVSPTTFTVGQSPDTGGVPALGLFRTCALLVDGVEEINIPFHAQAVGAKAFPETANGVTVTVNQTAKDAHAPLKVESAAYYPGTDGNFVSTPHTPGLVPSGVDLEFEFDLDFPDYRAETVYVIDKMGGSGTRSYRVFLSDQARWQFDYSEDGTVVLSIGQDTGMGLVNGSPANVRLEVVGNDGSGNRILRSYLDGDLHESTVRAGVINSIFNATTRELAVMGRSQGGAMPKGVCRRAFLRDGVGGTTLATFDADAFPDPYKTWTDPQGNVWTVSRSAGGRKVAWPDPPLLFGPDDINTIPKAVLPALGADVPWTIVFDSRSYGEPGTPEYLWDDRGASGPGRFVAWQGPALQADMSDATGSTKITVAAQAVDGPRQVISVRNDPVGRLLSLWLGEEKIGEQSTATLGDTTNNNDMGVMGRSGGGDYQSAQGWKGLFYEIALSDEDMARLPEFLEGGVSPAVSPAVSAGIAI